MQAKIQDNSVKQYQNAGNLHKKSINPGKIKGLIFVFLLSIGSSAVLAGCGGDKTSTTETPPAPSLSPSGENSPALSTSPATGSSSGLSTAPSAGNSPALSTAPSAENSPALSTSPATSTPTTGSNIRKLETALQRFYTERAGVTLESVTCPDNANLKTGGAFECKATAQGVNFGIQININNEGKIDPKIKGLLILTKIEEFLQQTFKEKAKVDVTADCGGKLRAVKTGDTFTCKVTNKEGQTRNVTLTVKNEQGQIDVKL
jgi:hypothetical protein